MARTAISLGLAALLAAACELGPVPTPPPSASPTQATASPDPTASMPTPSPTPSDPLDPTPTPSATASPAGPSGPAWAATPLPVDAAYSTIGVIGVAALEGRFLAVGVGWQEDDNGVTVNVPLFWLSADGARWDLVPDAAWPGGDIDLVSTWRGEFLAAGHVGDERASAAFWTSPDGRQWDRLPDQPVLQFFRGATEGRDIVAGGIAALRVEGDELIATGWLYCACERELREGAVEWRTTDGQDWQRADGPAPDGWQQPIAGGPGRLRISVDGSAIEGSTDGATWQTAWSAPLAADQAAISAQLFALGLQPAGFLAVGVLVSDGRSSPLAVSSTDGRAWTRSAGWPAIDELEGTMLGFAAAPDAVVAVGPVGDPAQPYAWLYTPVIAGE